MNNLTKHEDTSALSHPIKISIGQLAERIGRLGLGEELMFEAGETECLYGVTRIRPFDADMILINCYGGGEPFTIDTRWDWEADRRFVVDSLENYCELCGIETVRIDEGAYRNAKDQPGIDPVPPAPDDCLVRQLAGIDHGRCPKLSVLQRFLLAQDPADELLVRLEDYYEQRIGVRAVWLHPFCDGVDLGGAILPVREGFAMLPYNTMTREDAEIYEPDKLRLLDGGEAGLFADNLRLYFEQMMAVLGVIERQGEGGSRDETDASGVSPDDERGLSCTLPGGARLSASLGGDADPALQEKQGWSSIDVGITFLNGRYLNLCAADFEEAGQMFQKDTLRIMLFADGEDDPRHTLTIDDFSGAHSATQWLHYACWLQHELADDTYDICIWDEIRNERADNMEEAHFPSLDAANARLMEIQNANRHIRWTRLTDKTGKG